MKYYIHLESSERSVLEAMLKKRTCQSQHYQYAQILLHSDQSSEHSVKTAETLAQKLDISSKTVERVRRKFCDIGMGIFDKTVRNPRSDKKLMHD